MGSDVIDIYLDLTKVIRGVSGVPQLSGNKNCVRKRAVSAGRNEEASRMLVAIEESTTSARKASSYATLPQHDRGSPATWA